MIGSAAEVRARAAVLGSSGELQAHGPLDDARTCADGCARGRRASSARNSTVLNDVAGNRPSIVRADRRRTGNMKNKSVNVKYLLEEEERRSPPNGNPRFPFEKIIMMDQPARATSSAPFSANAPISRIRSRGKG